jgi:hypothetical protein
MIVCIPYVNLPAMPYDYEALAKSIQKLGTFLTHSLHIVSRLEDEEAAYESWPVLDGQFRPDDPRRAAPSPEERVPAIE